MIWEEVLESAAKPRAPLPGKVGGRSDSEATPESGAVSVGAPLGRAQRPGRAPGLPGRGQRRGKARAQGGQGPGAGGRSSGECDQAPKRSSSMEESRGPYTVTSPAAAAAGATRTAAAQARQPLRRYRRGGKVPGRWPSGRTVLETQLRGGQLAGLSLGQGPSLRTQFRDWQPLAMQRKGAKPGTEPRFLQLLPQGPPRLQGGRGRALPGKQRRRARRGGLTPRARPAAGASGLHVGPWGARPWIQVHGRQLGRRPGRGPGPGPTVGVPRAPQAVPPAGEGQRLGAQQVRGSQLMVQALGSQLHACPWPPWPSSRSQRVPWWQLGRQSPKAELVSPEQMATEGAPGSQQRGAQGAPRRHSEPGCMSTLQGGGVTGWRGGGVAELLICPP